MKPENFVSIKYLFLFLKKSAKKRFLEFLKQASPLRKNSINYQNHFAQKEHFIIVTNFRQILNEKIGFRHKCKSLLFQMNYWVRFNK